MHKIQDQTILKICTKKHMYKEYYITTYKKYITMCLKNLMYSKIVSTIY